MKHFIAVLVCALFATALARPEVNKDAVKQSEQRIRTAHEKCQSDPATAVDENALRDYLKNGGPTPANHGTHTLCISKGLNWQNEDGSVNKATIESRAQNIFGGDNADIQQKVDECVVAQSTPEETAIHLFRCYRKHAPRSEAAAAHQH